MQSKERLAAMHRGHAPQPKRNTTTQTGKATFSLAKSDGTDEDEWVSSESGAATPLDADDGNDDQLNRTPVEQAHLATLLDHVNGATPRAQTPIQRIDTARPHEPLQQVQRAQAPVVHVQSSTPAPVEAKLLRQTRSEAPSPSQIRRNGDSSNRNSMVRRSSAHSVVKVEIPHHPLIRGQSYHGGLKPASLAPLAINPESAQAQLSASPTTARVDNLHYSPESMHSSLHRSPEADEPEARPSRSRKESFSSLHSVATLPAPSSSRVVGSRSRMNRAVDRTRTLSTLSTSSSSAALTSLNTLPAASRPGTPPLTVHFAPESQSRREQTEGLHQLLPPVYLASHLSTLARYRPLADCYERVMRAKNA
jgi:hypothetical protein